VRVHRLTVQPARFLIIPTHEVAGSFTKSSDHHWSLTYSRVGQPYWAIPLYLQHLLFVVSRWEYQPQSGYAEQPDCYDRLVNAALQVHEVTFVSLNYDDIFDQRLFLYDRLDSMESYLAPNKNWALIKLHGSINWGRQVLDPGFASDDASDIVLAQTFAALGADIKIEKTIELRPQPTVRQMRRSSGLELYYPALSAPLGADDDLVCPDEHVEYLKRITGHWNPLDGLVIGYSGLDTSVLKLLSWGERPIRSLTVVSETAEHAQKTAEKLLALVRVEPPEGVEPVTLHSNGFTSFTQAGSLTEYIARIRSIAAKEDDRDAYRQAGLMPPE